MINIPNRHGVKVSAEAAKTTCHESREYNYSSYVARSTLLRMARGFIGSSRFGVLGY